ncbi:Uncharacterized protein OBRU01_10646 [Operophtera brumata]|uniref:CUB domain-containing protein n=1 Tax=Operophtera brumata TaxID=104452 RepID=A0A0L7LDX5_OPEBR|nr:Uncharacterized protein OBRU01_10646 [Operophtera brumata]
MFSSPGCTCVRFTSTYGKERGTFSSPGYPRAYPTRLDCVLYTFLAQPHEIVELVFTDFDIYKEHLDSPGYPRAYPTRLDCVLYTFLAQPHEIVELVFTDFDIYKEHLE